MKKSLLLLVILVLMISTVVAQEEDGCTPEGEILIPDGQHFFIPQGVQNDQGIMESNYIEFCAVTGTLEELNSFMIIEGINFSYGWWLVDVYDSSTLEFLGQGWFYQRGIALNELPVSDASFFRPYFLGSIDDISIDEKSFIEP